MGDGAVFSWRLNSTSYAYHSPCFHLFLTDSPHDHLAPDHASVQMTVNSQGHWNLLGSHILPSYSPILGAQVTQADSFCLGL